MRAQQLPHTLLPVDQPNHLVLVVGHVAKPLAKHLRVDLEHGIERREELGQTAPLVEPSHAFHQERLRRPVDGALAQAHTPELEVKRSVAPKQVPIDRILADQFLDRSVDHRARVEGYHPRLPIGRDEGEHTGFPAHVDCLQQVDDAHLRKRAAEPRARVATLVLKPGARLSRELDANTGDHLTNVDRLGEVVLDAELQPTDLAFDRLIARQEHERDMRPFRILPQLFDELEAIQVAERRVGENQVRLVGMQDLERLPHTGTPGHVVAGVPEAHLEHAETTGIGIDDEKVLLGHCGLLSAGLCEWAHCHVKHAFRPPT